MSYDGKRAALVRAAEHLPEEYLGVMLHALRAVSLPNGWEKAEAIRVASGAGGARFLGPDVKWLLARDDESYNKTEMYIPNILDHHELLRLQASYIDLEHKLTVEQLLGRIENESVPEGPIPFSAREIRRACSTLLLSESREGNLFVASGNGHHGLYQVYAFIGPQGLVIRCKHLETEARAGTRLFILNVVT